MPELYRLLADFVVIVHFAYVLSVILGLGAILLGRVFGWQWVRNVWFRGVHLAMILIVVFGMSVSACPAKAMSERNEIRAGR